MQIQTINNKQQVLILQSDKIFIKSGRWNDWPLLI